MWLLLAVAAHAQDDLQFDGQLFRPSSDSLQTLWTEDTHTAPDGYVTGRAFLQYAYAPVRWKGADDVGEKLASDLFALDFAAAFRWRTVRLGAHLPFYGYTAGELSTDEPGLGDISIDLKGTVLDRDKAPLGLALMGRLMLPTNTVSVPLGARSPNWEVMAVVDRVQGPLTLLANIGTREIEPVSYEDLVWNDQVFGRLAGAYQLGSKYGVAAELAAQTNWASQANPAGTPVELMGSGWFDLTNTLVLRGGASIGLSRSPGAPVFRALAGISWEPDLQPDRDLDGVSNKADRCPDEPEDQDGYADDDGCTDRSYTAEFRIQNRMGALLDGVVTLEGPEKTKLDRGDRFAALHPGTYQVRADVDGYSTWTGPIDVHPEQGEQFTITMAPLQARLRLWAYDPEGRLVPATVEVSGGEPASADGTPISLDAGEHAIVVKAPGYVPGTTSITVAGGEQREITVTLAPSASPVP
jgi:PEGA domain